MAVFSPGERGSSPNLGAPPVYGGTYGCQGAGRGAHGHRNYPNDGAGELGSLFNQWLPAATAGRSGQTTAPVRRTAHPRNFTAPRHAPFFIQS